ncbi:MAG: Hsp20/alpha crystallin family protein [Chloroflexi bacterium]|nr:Hsp20/alpha crystallin family protein [Chloroflexota bacterium]
MAMELWRPMREMRRLSEEMDRLMEETFGPFELRTREMLPTPRTRVFPLNMYRKNNELIVEASLPGIRPEDVDVSVSGNRLTIRAERKEAKEVKEENYYYQEMVAGSFFREVALPTDVQTDKAEAAYENGILRLRFPVAPTAKESHIKIKTAGAK